MLKIILEAFTGVVMIVLGILFFLYIPSNALNLATNSIFIGAGLLIIKRAFDNNKKAKLVEAQTRRAEKQKRQRASKK